MRLILECCLLLLVLFFGSCTNNKENLVYENFNKGFNASYKLVNHQNQLMLSSLEAKMLEPASKEKAELWYPKALAIKNSSDAIINYIELKKGKLIKEQIAELNDSLENYKLYILNVDPSLKTEFYDRLDIDNSILKNQGDIREDNYVPLLSYLQNNIAIASNTLIGFCNDHVGAFTEHYDQFSAIIGLNTSYVKPGEQIELVAGVGAFSKAANPKISVAGINIPVGADNAVHYKFVAPNQIGKHIMPVKVIFRDVYGKPLTISKDVEFTVIK